MSRTPWLPIALLALLMLAIGGYLLAAGKFIPRVHPDTASYVQSPVSSLRGMLDSPRMPGYPLLLAAVRQASPGFAAIPAIQYLAFCAAVFVFYAGLRLFILRDWIASLVAGSLLLSNLVQNCVQDVLSDTLVAALGVAVVGLTMIAVGRGARWWILMLLAAAVAAAWLTRPAYLFLVLLVPLWGALLAARCDNQQGASVPGLPWKKALALLGLVVLVPLLAWCSLRWAVVGRFGATPPAGNWLIGYAGQFLTPQLVDELPDDVWPLADAVLKRRAELPSGTLEMTDAPLLSFARIDRNFAATMEYVPAALREYRQQPNQGPVDNALVEADVRRLAMAIIKARPMWYPLCLCKAIGKGMSQTCADVLLTPLGLGLVLMTLAATLAVALRRWNSGGLGNAPENNVAPGTRCANNAVRPMFVLASLYYALALLNIVVATPPAGRMTDAAAIFLPAVLMAVLIERVAAWRAGAA